MTWRVLTGSIKVAKTSSSDYLESIADAGVFDSLCLGIKVLS